MSEHPHPSIRAPTESIGSDAGLKPPTDQSNQSKPFPLPFSPCSPNASTTDRGDPPPRGEPGPAAAAAAAAAPVLLLPANRLLLVELEGDSGDTDDEAMIDPTQSAASCVWECCRLVVACACVYVWRGFGLSCVLCSVDAL
jgi:hypothetical protein